MEESNSNNHIANNVARAIVVALDWNSTPDARKAAVSFLGSVDMLEIRKNKLYELERKELQNRNRRCTSFGQHIIRSCQKGLLL